MYHSFTPLEQGIEILFQDDHLVVINKPAGLLSIPDGYNAGIPHIRSVLQPSLGPLWIVHRLDKETSGALILARSLTAHKALNQQFETRLVHKIYHTVISGTPPWQEQIISLALKVNGDRHHRTVVAPLTGKPAQTHLKIMHRTESTSLLQASPLTGYTHQIRAHLFAVGFPILGDPLYKSPQSESSSHSVSRLMLHAYQVHFLHPNTLQPLDFSAPYPADFSTALLSLGFPS